MGWETDFRAAAQVFDWPRVTELAESYARALRERGGSASSVQVRSILRLLRENLRYDEVLQVADAALGQGLADDAPGPGRADATIRHQYAQALVERQNPAASLLIFRALVDDPAASAEERLEARGGVGRCYKQLFVLHSTASSRVGLLQRSLAAYREAHAEQPRTWHGINIVALLRRALRDGIAIPGEDDGPAAATRLADDILRSIEADPNPDAWSLATACEACLGLDRYDDAVEWAARFADDRDADPFKIASFLRQLQEIWQLDTLTEPGDTLLRLLRSALLDQAGGDLVVETRDVRAARLGRGVDLALEKVLGSSRYRTLRWYETGLQRCRAVARLETVNEDGIGTGFLVAGKDLHDALPDTVLVTNGHVVPEALVPGRAVAVFRGLDSDGVHRHFRVRRTWWYERSDSPGLDTALLELDGYPDAVTPVPLAGRLPNLAASDRPRAYVIGHPRGLEQPQFSLQDNVLLDYDETFLHYRSPTEGGSSGSPVFDGDWKLIGVHHSGGTDVPRLNNRGGSYPANEAISVPAITARLRQRPPSPSDPAVRGACDAG